MKTSGTYPRVSLSFARKIDTDLIAFARNVITLMTDNAQYPAPSPTLKVLGTTVDALETAVHDALGGGKIAIATRNAARAEMLSLLRQEAAYVTGNCNADLVLLLSSGFAPVKAPSPVGLLPAPENLRFSLTGISGELHLRFNRVHNAANYSVQTAQNPEGPWVDQDLSTSTRVTISGLTPGKVYWVRAQANGSAGPSGWGGPANAMAV
jgi:Fibronectin type III domain